MKRTSKFGTALKIRSLTICLFAAGINVFSGSDAVGQTAMTPVEAFIYRIKEATDFVPVNNVWQADNNLDKTNLLKKVERVQPLTIDYAAVGELMSKKKLAIALDIPGFNGSTYTIELGKFDFMAGDFQVHTLGAGNKDELFRYTPGVYYRGIVKGIPGSLASFSFFNNEVYGIFSIPGEGNYNVVPNTQTGTYFGGNTHYLLFNDNELKIKDMAPECTQDQLEEFPKSMASKGTTIPNNKVYNNCTEVRVFEVGDYALYQTKGSSVTNVTNYLTSLFNNQATIYRNEGVPIVLGYLQVNTTRDNYQNITVSSSKRFLDTFGFVTRNTLHGCDLAILMSTALNGGYGALGGVAWLKSMCEVYRSSSFFGPYGFCNLDNGSVINFPTYSWAVTVASHEMGHMVGSPHTHKCCWNPSGAGTTAIDGCYTIEGSCSRPGNPAGGGTIMSYCHLTSVGINFTNGFGKQPGDTVRNFLATTFSSSCGAPYFPSNPIQAPNKTLAANRECTDVSSGITYYWNDNNTADHADDSVILMIKKNGNNIGNLDSAGFAVSTNTITGFGSGSAQLTTFPSGTPSIQPTSYSMRRYWNMTPKTQPSTNVEVIYPFTSKDSADLDGSVPGAPLQVKSYLMYKVGTPIDPSPAGGFTGATGSSFKIFSYATAATATNWSLSMAGTTYRAHMLMNNLSGGGTGFYTYRFGVDAQDIDGRNSINYYIFPNPTSASWTVSFQDNSGKGGNITVYAADGKLVAMMPLENGINTIPAEKLPAGLYYYRLVTSENTHTGNLVKE